MKWNWRRFREEMKMVDDRLFVLVAGIAFFCLVFFSMYKSSEEREKYKYESVCYAYDFESGRGFKHILVYYYYKGSRLETFESVDGLEEEYLNKYYKIVFSSKNPSNSEVLYEQEIVDKKDMIKAGFTMNEILDNQLNDLFLHPEKYRSK